MRLNLPITALIIGALTFASMSPAQTGSWGDQGDGTYRNPILNADYPDVDIEKHGDSYYMITSTVHYAPGMTILESRDLVNWTIIGHVFDKLTWRPDYNHDAMSGYSFAVWAGDLAYNDGKWYCYFIDTRSGLYVSWAEDIHGPWSEPVEMLAKTRWTDPAVYWDHETEQAWLVCNFGADPNRPGAGNRIRMFRMSWDGLRLLDEGQDIYHGPGAEAAKIYKIDGAYYIFLVEWIDNDRQQFVLRGPSALGPFEKKLLLVRHPKLDRSTCQGALVPAPDGSWWYTHQLVQHRSTGPDGRPGPSTDKSYEGRSQWLIPVRWEDGWPLLGEDATGDGIGNTVFEHRKPIAGFPIAAPQTSDEFSEGALEPQWQWNHNPRDGRWSLTERPGWLRLKANLPVNGGGFWNASNTISQRIMGKGAGMATAKIDVSKMRTGQQAGLCHHSGQFVLLGVTVGFDNERRLFYEHDGVRKSGPEFEADVIYIRTGINGPRGTFSYSFDGESWTRFGPEFPLTFGRWRGDRIGFFNWNDNAAAGHIDIDWFRYTYDGPQ